MLVSQWHIDIQKLKRTNNIFIKSRPLFEWICCSFNNGLVSQIENLQFLSCEHWAWTKLPHEFSVFVQKQKQQWDKVSEFPCSAKNANTVAKLWYIYCGWSLWAQHHLFRASIACLIDATKLAVLLSTEHYKVPFISLFLCQQMGLQPMDLRDFSQ